jgi:putative toxin-antitoxin system antitoxin component (TIGR02293 family)
MTTASGLLAPESTQSIGELAEATRPRATAGKRNGKRSGALPNPRSSLRAVRQVEQGIPKADAARLFAKIAAVAERLAGKLRAELIPESSWKRSGERLRPTASNTVARLRRVFALAVDIWQDESNAIQRLLGRHRLLGWETPYSLLKTEAGGRSVENLLAALDNGFPSKCSSFGCIAPGKTPSTLPEPSSTAGVGMPPARG